MSYIVYPTHINNWDNCKYQYFLRHIEKVKTEVQSSNLVFGKTTHSILEHIILNYEQGQAYDPGSEFKQLWTTAVSEQTIQYSSTMSREDLEETGAYLVNEFQKKWQTLELSPLLDSKGKLFLEQKLTAPIFDRLSVGAILDFAGINADNEVVVLDFKTPAVLGCDEHVMNDNQIMAQQVVLDAHKQEYGIETVHRIGFLDLIKKKVPKPLASGKYRKDAVWPTINDPKTIKRRSERSISEFKNKLIWMYEDRERGRFPKTPRMAYNSPCALCDYAQYCTTGSKEGLIFPNSNQLKIVS